jgi:hypothetical protein
MASRGAPKVLVWDIATRLVVWKSYLEGENVRALAFSSNSNLLAVGCVNGNVFVINTVTWQRHT